MPSTRKQAISRRLDTAAGEGTGQVPPARAGQSEAQSEMSSHTSSTSSPLEDIRRDTSPTVPLSGTTNHDMRSAVQLLTRLVAAQTQRQNIGAADKPVSVRVRDFINLDPPVFTGSDPKEDPQTFIELFHRTLRVMHASDTEAVELASYRLRDLAVFCSTSSTGFQKSTSRGRGAMLSSSGTQNRSYALVGRQDLESSSGVVTSILINGPELIHQAIEKVKVIQDRLRTAQSKQKSYSDVRHRDLEFEVGDWVFLRISPMKGVMRFGKKGKLSLRYIGPYKILRRIGQVAYELELPSELEFFHPVFRVSMLRKCIGDPSRVVPINDVEVTEDLPFEEVPIAILDRQVRKLRTKNVASVKIEDNEDAGGMQDAMEAEMPL
ncbi:PREDICTED: uncharacterized protein LOC109237836 [Nicotiana attenuata]|uniref:uncharacterized protein LOC109237836 n=1 Tax=Nicotiana attenuata TaxID=49451 RepID=UPI0009048D1A|nr:PREDICTED: uncharacterized protein LOC109237836 [Nicotiana attenuata]